MIKYHINEMIKERGYKKKDIAEACGWSNSTLKCINDGKDLKISTINKICEFLNCQPGDLLEYVPDVITEEMIKEEEKRQLINEEKNKLINELILISERVEELKAML